jgi:hypothetical protein
MRENKDYMNREYIEERRDSVAKYISTLYLEGRFSYRSKLFIGS